MLSFKQYLNEKWSFSKSKWHEPRHVSNIGGQEVGVYFSRRGTLGERHYEVSFAVGGHIKKPGELSNQALEPHHAMHVLKHVHKQIDKFIGRYKPHTLKFTSDSSEPSRGVLYKKLTDKIVAKHGGTPRYREGHFENTHSIQFNRDK